MTAVVAEIIVMLPKRQIQSVGKVFWFIYTVRSVL